LPQLYGQTVEEAGRQAQGQISGGFGASPPMDSSGGLQDRLSALEARSAPAAGVSREELSDLFTAMKAQQDNGIPAQAQGSTRGELFEYAIREPVTIPKQQAAMVPIVSQNIAGERVSIYNPTADRERALNGFRLQNNTGLHLAGGPITVFQDGIYAGDAQITSITPGQDRLISYAVDLELIPAVLEPKEQAETVSLVAKSGILTVTRKQTRTLTYTIRNTAPRAKRVLIQQPIAPDFKLLQPTKNVEKTASEYRFLIDVPAKQTSEVKIATERPITQTIALSNLNLNGLLEYTQNAQASPALRAALQGLVTRREKVTDLQTQRAELEKEFATIDAEQNRIRQNMQQLDRNSALYKQYVEKLTAQETRIEKVRTEIERLRQTELTAQNELRKFVDDLTLT
jgi:hypothetical protein